MLTNAVVAICEVLVPVVAVGAVGNPVNVGDARGAFNNISAELLVILDVFAAIALVFAVMLDVFDVIFVSKAFSALVALVISAVILAVFAAMEVGKVAIVTELTPPTLFTVGKSAVPPKSFANCNFPLTVLVASGVVELVILEATKAVVAT